MVGRNKLHEITIDLLLERLARTGKYGLIRREYWYDQNGLTGELDVYARRRDIHLYFEIKSIPCPAVVRKAQHQAFRVVTAHPQDRWRCLLVYPPKGHPARWMNDPRPALQVLRIKPTCHHLSPARAVQGFIGTGSCSLCGGVYLPQREFDVAGRAESERLLAYSEYLRSHTRRALDPL